ncbi:hypothetical protein M885DRAFT_521917 [Pelagophyceae sp. CCMP2097]|nr:hypothetical protein M885DRAFT_521917 [Pelagophyceae sp. CCMP2097]
MRVLALLCLGLARALVPPRAQVARSVVRATLSEAPAEAEFVSDLPDSAIPGKMTLTPVELSQQSRDLDALASRWTRAKDLREWEESRLTGFSEQSEIINGRSAMFFLVVGLLTEYWTGQSIVEQVATMLRIAGFLGL